MPCLLSLVYGSALRAPGLKAWKGQPGSVAAAQKALFRGVYPVKFKGARDPERALNMAEDELLKRGAVNPGDYMILTIGEPFGKAGGTNTMKIVKVGEHRRS